MSYCTNVTQNDINVLIARIHLYRFRGKMYKLRGNKPSSRASSLRPYFQPVGEKSCDPQAVLQHQLNPHTNSRTSNLIWRGCSGAEKPKPRIPEILPRKPHIPNFKFDMRLFVFADDVCKIPT